MTAKRTIIRTLAKETQAITAKFYNDSGWEGVNMLIERIRSIIAGFGMIDKHAYDVNITVSHEGYRRNESGQVWKEWNLNVDTEEGKEIIGGIITASPAGTMEDPWNRYDLTLQLW